MSKAAKFLSQLGCLVAVLAPLMALVIYPTAKWLFAFALIGVAVLLLNHLFAEDIGPRDLADRIERLLNGNHGGWDVDDFEHLGIRDPQLKEFWHRTMSVGGLPEKWLGLDEGQKHQLREVIRELRELGDQRGQRDAARIRHE